MSTPTNLKLPRYRKTVARIINEDLVSSFKEKHPDYKLSREDIEKIVKTFNERLYKEIVYKREGAYLPEDMGLLRIMSFKQYDKKTSLDPKVLHESGVKVEFNNLQTDGHIAKILYSSYSSMFRFTNREYWGFKACRNFTRETSRNYRENWEMYDRYSGAVADKKKRELLNKNKSYFQNRVVEAVSEEYDEFNMN